MRNLEERPFKHTSVFASVVKCIPNEKSTPFFAKASIEDLKAILPDVTKKSDLLPIAANACVINLGNKNGDVVDTKTALAMYKNFEDKFINLEHDRTKIVGHIKTAVLSKFNPNYSNGVGSEIISEDAIQGDEPFNISLAGFIYKVAAPGVAKTILDANDPYDQSFLAMAMSWEVGFDDYKIVVGGDTVAGSEIIDRNNESFATYDKYLKANKGKGETPDGKKVFRLLIGENPEEDVMPLGVGLTFNPAGAVAGIVTNSEAEASANNDATATEAQPSEKTAVEEIIKKDDENISQTALSNVTSNTNMKSLASFKDVLALNDETVKEYSVANVANIISAEIERVSSEHDKAIKAEQAAKQEAETKLADALAKVTANAAELETLKGQITELQNQQAVAAAQVKFNERMAGFDETHELTDEVRQVLASAINGLSDEAFAAYRKQFEILYAAKSKAAIAAAAEAAAKSTDTTAVVKEAVASTTTQKNDVTNPPAAEVPLAQKFAAAFKVGEGVTVK